jgi:hypothetical protein
MVVAVGHHIMVVIMVVVVAAIAVAVGPEMAVVRKTFHPPPKALVQDMKLSPLRLQRQARMALLFHRWTLPLSQARSTTAGHQVTGALNRLGL